MAMIEPYHEMTYTLIGISHKSADTQFRGRYTIDDTQLVALFSHAKMASVQDLFVLSTCNRTELYALCRREEDLIDLLFTVIDINYKEDFLAKGYTKRGKEAIAHLFRVSAGLDAQILGDYEIVGQVKTAFHKAKELSGFSAFGERVFHTALQASKEVRSQTQISGGTVSASYAAVRTILETYPENYRDKRVLIIGYGTVGQPIFANLKDLAIKDITLINRNMAPLEQLKSTHPDLRILAFSELPFALDQADIILSATAHPGPLIFPHSFASPHPRLLIDLSIPNNIAPETANLPYMTLKNIDDVSATIDETLKKREAEIPKAEALLHTILEDLIIWIHERKQMAILKDIKARLISLNDLSTQPNADNLVQKHLSELAVQFKRKGDFMGCSVITTYKKQLYGEGGN